MPKKLFYYYWVNDRVSKYYEILFEPRDLWIGLYWNKELKSSKGSYFHLYICIIPMFPIHLYWLINQDNLSEEEQNNDKVQK